MDSDGADFIARIGVLGDGKGEGEAEEGEEQDELLEEHFDFW